MRTNRLVPDVQKIAVLRANAIGDFIFTLPALHALRQAYPKAEIVLLGREWHQKFLANRPGPVDRVVAIPYEAMDGEAKIVDPAIMQPITERLAGEKFDLALQLHGGGGNSNLIINRLEARLTAGMRTPEAPPLDRWIPYVYFQSEYLRYLEVVALVGATTSELEPHLAVTTEDLNESCRVVPESKAPLVVFHPGASVPNRRWPAARFAAVADALAEAGCQVVISGAGNENLLSEEIIATMRQPALDVCGKLSLGGLAGLLSRSALVISNDSGPLHLAGAVGAATVGLYWAINVITAAPPYRERHRPLISWQTRCPTCGTDCIHSKCGHDSSLIEEIEVAEVLTAAHELLSQYSK
ncbi:MAG TPA: glycosyltransferase family 9 protein [Chloroflexia bacterium]|nr:glycosyltransferase family 9 protein [Chloroflexia bacterium]